MPRQLRRKRVVNRQPQFRILPYKMGSKGASQLAEGLRSTGVRGFKVYPDRNYNPRARHTIINWGSGSLPNWYARGVRILNNPMNVALASNKLDAFQTMQERGGISLPEFTTRWGEADDWVQDGGTVIVRHKLQGHSGDGIEIISHHDEIQDLPEAPLYVKYIKKKAEYRVHVFRDTVLDVQQKRKRRDMNNDEVNYQVRNHHNGWVFCRDDVNPHDDVLSNAIAAVRALGLDFGAVDVIWNEHHQRAYVLEVNTAPGLEGTTLANYVNKLTEVINNEQI